MKKLFGFTLAEVLVTIAVLGVVAALTFPALMMNLDKNQWTTGLKTNKSLIERAFSKMLAENNVDTLDLTPLWLNVFDKDDTKIIDQSLANELMKQYFKVSKVKTGKQSDDIYQFGTATSSTVVDGLPCYILVNGVFLYIDFHNVDRGNIFADIYVDVNGKKRPNTLGKDIFAFGLTEDGVLLPYGSDELNEFDSTKYIKWDTKNGCKGNANTITDGRTCTARIVENDYQMDY